MNKKIKVIDLLNKIANGEIKNNTYFNIINEDGDVFKCKYSSIYPGYIWRIADENISFNYKIDHMRILSYEVEILEDNTEEIEELEYFNIGKAKSTDQTKMIDKINELVKAVNEMKEESEDKQ